MVLNNGSEKGFTLVSLLIVLVIVTLLSAMVILSFTGMFERGNEQAMETETDVIQTAVNLFKADIHKGVADGIWGAGSLGHYFPTDDGKPGLLTLSSFPITVEDGDYESVLDGIIWMGLLANAPGSATANDPAGASPQAGEDGPYLNEIPESASAFNGRNDQSGPYTWVVLSDGTVAALEVMGNNWILTVAGDTGGAGDEVTPSPAPPGGETYTLEIASTSGGDVLVPGEGVFIYEAGEEVLIDAFPAGCNEFVEWTGDVDTVDDTTARTTNIVMNGDYSITASFVRGEFVVLNIEVVPENESWISLRDEATGEWAVDIDGLPVDGTNHRTPTTIMVPLGDYILYVEQGAWSDEVNLPALSPAVCEVTISVKM